MSTGYLYVMTNPAIEGLVKIGLSLKDPATFRVKELSSTSLPQNFVCRYWALVEDVERKEKLIFTELSNFRPNPKREYFKISVAEAIDKIRSSVNVLADKSFYDSDSIEPAYTVGNEVGKLQNTNSVGTRKGEADAFDWEKFVGKVVNYCRYYGNPWINDGFKGSKVDKLGRLGSQAIKARELCRLKKIPEDKEQFLRNLGFILDSEEAWRFGFKQLTNVVQKSGVNPNRIVRYETVDGFNLGAWLRDQKKYFLTGKLEHDKLASLRALGLKLKLEVEPIRRGKSVYDSKWEKNFEILKLFKAERGHANPSTTEDYQDVRLGRWLARQRADKKQGLLAQSREERLSELGVIWDRHEQRYRRGLEAYRQHVRDGGHPNVHQHYITPDGFPLGRWVLSRRAERSGTRGSISDERISELDRLGFVWKAN